MSVGNLIGKSFLKEFSFFSSSTIILQISRVAVEVTVAKIVGPTTWGMWYLLNLLIAYRGVFTFGIDNGMNREVPIRLGAGFQNEAEDLQNTTFSTLLFSTLVVSGILLFSTFFIDSEIQNYFLSLVLLFGASQFYHFLSLILKSNFRFNLVSKKQYLAGLLLPFFSVILSKYLGLDGFIIGYSLALLIPSFFILKESGIKLKIVSNVSKSIALIKIGFPIMAVGITYTFLNTIDRWLIGIYYGTESLGFYSLSIIIFAGLILFPKIISQQVYPRMASSWGRSKSLNKLKYLSYKQSIYTFYLITPILIVVFILVEPMITMVLPEYREGISSARIIVFGSISMILSAGWGNVLNILDKQVYYLTIIIIGLILNLGFNLIFIKLELGIEGIALGTLLSFTIYNVLLTITGMKVIKNYK